MFFQQPVKHSQQDPAISSNPEDLKALSLKKSKQLTFVTRALSNASDLIIKPDLFEKKY